jgi:hypothetical protein
MAVGVACAQGVTTENVLSILRRGLVSGYARAVASNHFEAVIGR